MIRRVSRQFGLLLTLATLIGWGPNRQRSSGYGDQLGVVNIQPTRACLITRNASLTAGTQVLMVSLTTPQATLHAQVVQKSATVCPPINPGDPTLSGYELRIVSEGKQGTLFAIGIFPPPRVIEQAGLIAAEIGGKKLLFRSCTSVDGAHFTAWENKPLFGKPVWHQYHYLGYDVEPNCSKAETIR